jgi:hypothetical protein
MKVYLIILVLLFSISKFSFSQNKQTTIEEIEKTLASTMDAKDIKDSIALYTFCIQVNIKNVKGKSIVTGISVNDLVAKIIFKDIYLLKKINYSSFLGNKKNISLNIPIAYIVANYKANDLTEKKINIIGIQDNLYKLFNCTKKGNCITLDSIYLNPIIITVDKAVYD